MADDEKPVTKTRSAVHPQLMGKKITIRLVSGGQPITGTVEGYNQCMR